MEETKSSIVCVGDLGYHKKNFHGLSKDADKLPKLENIPDMGSGSSCLMLDTLDYYIYLKPSDTWYKVA